MRWTGGRISSGYGYVFGKPQFWDHSVGDGTGIGISSGQVALYSNSGAALGVTDDATNGVRLSYGMPLGWSSSGAISSASDVRLYRDAANGLAQRVGTNAQTFNIYNTYTDGSNYERGFLKWNSNELLIGTEALGTGTALNVKLQSAGSILYFGSGGNVQWTVDSGRNLAPASAGATLTVGTDSAALAGTYFKEVTAPSSPSSNRVVVYAEDNGSGKTRLMALFQTGVAQQIAIEP